MNLFKVRTGSVIIAEPYRFVPPYRSVFWLKFFQPFGRTIIRRVFGISPVEIRGAQHLRDSVARGHGILLTSNHCRHSDSFMLGLLNAETGRPLHLMATWHLFKQGWLLAALLRRWGAFSVYREGSDRMALKAAVTLLTEARRPLLIFPEGMVSRSNDYLRPFMDGVALIARGAARQRAAFGGCIVVHPVAVRYWFDGDLDAAITPAIEEMETRFGWTPGREFSLQGRAFKLGEELLGRAEEKHLGVRQTGSAPERITRLVDQILQPLEKEWPGGHSTDESFSRMKRLRSAILHGLIDQSVSQAETARRWEQLGNIDVAERWYRQPPTHLVSCATPEQLLETVERIEEMILGSARPYGRLRAMIQVGEAIEISGPPGRAADVTRLPEQIRARIEGMLAGKN